MPIYYTVAILRCYNWQSNKVLNNKLHSPLILNCNKKLYRLLTCGCRFSTSFAALREAPFWWPNDLGRVDKCDPGHNLPDSREL